VFRDKGTHWEEYDKIKVIGKFHPRKGHEGREGEYSFFNLGAGCRWVEGRSAMGLVWTKAVSLTSTMIRSPDRPVCSESLYRIRYPSPRIV